MQDNKYVNRLYHAVSITIVQLCTVIEIEPPELRSSYNISASARQARGITHNVIAARPSHFFH